MEIKHIICNELENKKQKLIDDCNEKIKTIQNEDNFASLYYLVNKTFNDLKDNQVKRELGMNILKHSLQHSFFKTSKIKYEPNYIVFEDEEFAIKFSTFLSKEIIIKYKKTGNRESNNLRIDNSVIELYELTKAFYNKKSFKNLKRLADCYGVRYKKNFIAQALKFINTHKKCNMDFIHRVENQKREFEFREFELLELNKMFDFRQEYAKAFMDDMKRSLADFIDDEWIVNYYGVVLEDGSIKC